MEPRTPYPVGASALQRGGILLWALLVLVGAGIGAVIVFYLIFTRVELNLLVENQPATAIVPVPMSTRAMVLNDLDIQIDERIDTVVPVDTVLSVPVNEPLQLMATFDAQVPISHEVRVQDTIVIEQLVDIDTMVEADVLGDTFLLPLRGSFPVRAEVPVDILIPIDQEVHMAFTAPVTASLKQDLVVPLKTEIAANVPLRTRMQVPLLNAMQGDVFIPLDPMALTINYADLNIPLRTVRLGWGQEEDDAEEPVDTAGKNDNRAPPVADPDAPVVVSVEGGGS